MDIGTAKPGAAELARVRHHLVDIRSPGEPVDVAQFRTLARAAIAEIAARGRPMLVTGGSGLYLRVLRYGIFSGPGAAPAIRQELLEAAARHGVEYLYDELRRIDAAAARRLEPHDLYRIVRAIEVFRLTGVTISQHQAAHGFARPEYETLTIGLRMDRERLYQAIEQRFDAMMAAGLVEEVQALLAAGLHAAYAAAQHDWLQAYRRLSARRAYPGGGGRDRQARHPPAGQAAVDLVPPRSGDHLD